MIAANVPDLDLVYTNVIAPPLGYLVHHRGHTHTVIGAAVLAAVLILVYRVLPPVRRMPLADRARIWMVIAIGLASHVLLDALNSYGIHPYHPMDATWYYGDAVFIFEPILWIILGLALAPNAKGTAARMASLLPVVILPLVMAWMGIIPLESLLLLAAAGALWRVLMSPLAPRVRAAAALVVTGWAIAALIGLSRMARTASVDILQPHLGGELVDVALTPNPASPLCWSVIGIERIDAKGEYVLWRGTLTLAPRFKPAESCASHRLTAASPVRMLGANRFVLRDEIHQSLHHLRRLAERNCRVRAWLRFGRAPVVTGNEIYDLRFDAAGQNFSRMPIDDRSECPRFVPGWSIPRADLLSVVPGP